MAASPVAQNDRPQGSGDIPQATVTAVVGRKYINKRFPKETKHVFWASVECGLVLPSMGSGGQGEVQDHRGLYVQILQGLLEGEPRGDQAAPDHGVAQRQGHMLAAGDGRAPGAAIYSVDP